MHLSSASLELLLESWWHSTGLSRVCPHLLSTAVLKQKMPTDQASKLVQDFRRSCPDTGPQGANWAPARRSPSFSRGSTVLKGHAHQAGDDVIETDELRRTVRPFDAHEDYGRLIILMDGDIQRALAGDANFLSDVVTAGWERTTRFCLSYIGHAFCNSL